MNTALFWGVFDPVTNGHLWVVARSLALDLFDRIVVAVDSDPARSTIFTVEERLNLWRDHAQMIHAERIEVIALAGEAPARAARRLGCHFLIRGLRNVQEYEAEAAVQRVNHELEPMVQTVFLMPDDDVVDISAAHVRDMIGTPGWKESVKQYVSVPTWEALVKKFGSSRP